MTPPRRRVVMTPSLGTQARANHVSDRLVDQLAPTGAGGHDHGQVTETIEPHATERTGLLAERLHDARRDRTLLDADVEATSLSLDRAYAVQEHLTSLRLAEGRCHVGYKLGYTS